MSQSRLSYVLESVLFRFIYGEVTVRNSLKTLTANYNLKAKAIQTNLADAKDMAQTSMMILSKWENIIQVIDLVWGDCDFKSLSPTINLKKSFERIRTFGTGLVSATNYLAQKIGKRTYDSIRLLSLFWVYSILKSISWARSVLSILMILGRKIITDNLRQHLTPYITAVKNYVQTIYNQHIITPLNHLLSFQQQLQENHPIFHKVMESSLVALKSLYSTLLSHLNSITTLEYTSQKSLLSKIVIPSTALFASKFLSLSLTSVIPLSIFLLIETRFLGASL
eukprot:TRINITY_DN4408_c0_g1_i1.p1 TRINITY_DN4408_c0_g1~~TRINITY_DN4408_c0_g1_i1.p1  ORF type:complete len:281 (-),score=22.22 TRINITY_DN4408_c0_g1_i1:226-1068(-)